MSRGRETRDVRLEMGCGSTASPDNESLKKILALCHASLFRLRVLNALTPMMPRVPSSDASMHAFCTVGREFFLGKAKISCGPLTAHPQPLNKIGDDGRTDVIASGGLKLFSYRKGLT